MVPGFACLFIRSFVFQVGDSGSMVKGCLGQGWTNCGGLREPGLAWLLVQIFTIYMLFRYVEQVGDWTRDSKIERSRMIPNASYHRDSLEQ